MKTLNANGLSDNKIANAINNIAQEAGLETLFKRQGLTKVVTIDLPKARSNKGMRSMYLEVRVRNEKAIAALIIAGVDEDEGVIYQVTNYASGRKLRGRVERTVRRAGLKDKVSRNVVKFLDSLVA